MPLGHRGGSMMEPQVVRSLGAILAIDIVGYSRQMGRD